MTSAQYNGLLAAIALIGSNSVTGSIILYGSIVPPSGYLPCDGASLSRATFAALFGVIGTSFGAADGLHFNVPDLRSRLPMGVGAGPGLTVRALADQGGAEGAAVDKANLTAFALDVTDPGHAHTGLAGVEFGMGAATVMGAAGADFTTVDGADGPTATAVTGITVASGGSATPLPTVDPFTAVAYFIKT